MIFALGLRHVGAVAAKLIAEHFKSMDNLMNASFNDLEQVKGVGEETAEPCTSAGHSVFLHLLFASSSLISSNELHIGHLSGKSNECQL